MAMENAQLFWSPQQHKQTFNLGSQEDSRLCTCVPRNLQIENTVMTSLLSQPNARYRMMEDDGF